MALIKCPECKKKISDQCENCPHCGYPIKVNLTSDTTDGASNSSSTNKQPLFKCVWFWGAVAVVVVAAAIMIILLLNREDKPKVDENGNPVFVELTDAVYTNADEYLGYYVNVKGKVFQNLGDDGETKGVQIWIDPDNCEQNIMIHYTTDESFKDGDYIICTGYIKEIHKYTNTYGTELSVPLVYSTDLRSASYIEVMSPTVSTIVPKNLTYEKYGYSITIDKIEFAENETRLYLTVINNGNATVNVDTDSSLIVQNKKQYGVKSNFDTDLEALPYSIANGASASGVVSFPNIENSCFEYIIEVNSDDYYEEFMPIVFRIGKEGATPKEYEVAIKNALAVMNRYADKAYDLFPEALWEWIDINSSNSRSELEEMIYAALLLDDQPKDREIPYAVNVETKLSRNEIESILENYKSMYEGIGIDSIEEAYNIEIEVMLTSTSSQYLNINLVKIDGKWYWFNILKFV